MVVLNSAFVSICQAIHLSRKELINYSGFSKTLLTTLDSLADDIKLSVREARVLSDQGQRSN